MQPIHLSHQLLLESKFKDLNLNLSEYTFANLYLFRKIHQYQLLFEQNEIFIKGLTRDLVPFVMLTSPPQKLDLELLKKVCAPHSLVYPIPDEWLPFFKKTAKSFDAKEEDFDYLNSSFKLAHFPGRYLSKKRNLIKQLTSKSIVYGDHLIHHLPKGIEILNRWRENQPSETDYEPCLEALHNFQQLRLSGRIIFVNHLPAGFSIGEPLSKECYVVHFSKGDRSMIGLYQYLYQDLAQSLKETFPWINLEQDLGLENLRQAKHSYLPEQLLKKWRVSM